MRVSEFRRNNVWGFYLIVDPDSTLDYSVNWAEFLDVNNSDVISSSEWIVPVTITLVSNEIQGQLTIAWLHPAVPGVRPLIVNRITTQSVPPRIQDQSFTLVIRSR